MSFINDDNGHQYAPWEWFRDNHPENGLFRVYWKNVVNWDEGGATFDPDEGEGLRWEWYYKDGERADGISRGWFPNGNLKSEQTYKDGKQNGLWIEYREDGMKGIEGQYENGIKIGTWFRYYENGQKTEERTYKNGKTDGLVTYWYMNGQKEKEGTYKNDFPDGLWTYYNEDGSIKELKQEIKEIIPDPYYPTEEVVKNE